MSPENIVGTGTKIGDLTRSGKTPDDLDQSEARAMGYGDQSMAQNVSRFIGITREAERLSTVKEESTLDSTSTETDATTSGTMV